MGSVSKITYNNLDIVYNDMSEAKPSEIFDLCFQSEELLKTYDEKSAYVLVNVKNIRFNSQVIKKIKETALNNKPYIKATAVCGVEGFTKAIHNMVINYSGRQMETVESPDEGMELLYLLYLKNKEVLI